jgi:hypothetical protein
MTYGIGNPRPGVYYILNCLCSTIANMLATTIRSNKDYKTDIYCFSTKHASLRNKSKDWWALNYDNMFTWKDMLICNSVCWSRKKIALAMIWLKNETIITHLKSFFFVFVF